MLPLSPAPAAPLWGGGLAGRIRCPYPRAASRLARAHTPGLPSPRPPAPKAPPTPGLPSGRTRPPHDTPAAARAPFNLLEQAS